MQARGKRKIAGLKDCNAITQSVVKIAKDANNYAKMVESGVKKSIISDFHIGCALLYVVLEGCALNLEENNKFLGAWQRKTSKP
jgi:formiminotetrahydrofolate cyclodeaminase